MVIGPVPAAGVGRACRCSTWTGRAVGAVALVGRAAAAVDLVAVRVGRASVELVGVAEDGVVALHGLSSEAADGRRSDGPLAARSYRVGAPNRRVRRKHSLRSGAASGSAGAVRFAGCDSRSACRRSPTRPRWSRWRRAAEAYGWDGFFLWDHLRWDGQVEVARPLGAARRDRPGDRADAARHHGHAAVAPPAAGGRQAPDHARPPQRRPGDPRRRPRRPARPRLLRLRRRGRRTRCARRSPTRR